MSSSNDRDDVLCLAVVRDSGRKVDVFDARGRARSFSFNHDGGGGRGCVEAGVGRNGGGSGLKNGEGGGEKLCFSTHCLGGSGDFDGLLTPCFDENGEHGEPEEGCFCGVDTPHLHAHYHDPERCGGKDGTASGSGSGCGGKSSAGSSGLEVDLGFLAQLTLHPVDSTEELEAKVAPTPPGEDPFDIGAPLLKMPVNESLPSQCNAREMTRKLSQLGLKRRGKLGRRMYKVQHDNHEDYLVLNEAKGLLHLEHPCDDCGDSDVHGSFNLVHKRKWLDADEENGFRLHFFEAAKKPFCLIDVLAHFFDIDTDRVRAIRCDNLDCTLCEANEPCERADALRASKPSFLSKTCPASCEVKATYSAMSADGALSSGGPYPAGSDGTVRSRFFVSKICCASEIPAINSIVEPLPGVSKVLINTTTKTVYVDHDPSRTTAQDIEAVLNKKSFGAQLRSDGGLAAAGTGVASSGDTPRVGRSHFIVDDICCASEIPAIKSIVEPIIGVKAVSINVTTKTVYLDHDIDVISAANLAKALSDEGFKAQVQKDAGHDLAMMSGLPTTSFVKSTFSFADLRTNEQSIAVANILNQCPDGQIREHFVCMSSKTVIVQHNPYFLSATGIVQLLCEDKLVVTIVEDGAADGMWALGLTEEAKEEKIDHQKSSVSPYVVMSGICWVISMLSFIGGNWEYLKYVGLLSVVFGLPPIFMKAYRTLRRCQFDANCMMLFAALGAVGLQEFTEAAAVTFLFAISEALETRATARARNALSAIVSLRPERANLINPVTKSIVVVPAASVGIGSSVSVRTGDKIPCDGIVIEGYSTVDESSLTGESRPVRKGPKDTVSGGTINSGTTRLIIKTTATVENSAVARLIRLVEEAQANRSQTEKIVDKFAKRYTPLVVLTALCMCSIPWAWGKEVGQEWTKIGLITMVVACPCALIISTPVTYVAGLAATAQKGIIIKGGAHLEALGRVKRIAFDKTGTLTEGDFALLHLSNIEQRCTREKVLQYLALMESPSSHPLAAALVKAAKNEGISIPKHVSVLNHTILKGEGVKAIVDGLEVHVGNTRLFQRLGLYDSLPEKDKVTAEGWSMAAGTVGFISIEGIGIVGSYSVADAVRQESSSVIQKLHELKIEVDMLTGDGKDAALAIGNQVGLPPTNIHSELLPEDKLELVSKMKAEGSWQQSVLCWRQKKSSNVLMCGDGVNDAPALALADVGVAIGAGAALAMETSDVTLMDSNLNKLVYSIRMGKRVLRTILENVIFSLVVKAVVMGFTFAGHSSLWAAIGSDVGAMLIVTMNGMKLLPSKKKVKMMSVLQREKDEDIEAETIAEEENKLTPHDDSSGKVLDIESAVAFVGTTELEPESHCCCETSVSVQIKCSAKKDCCDTKANKCQSKSKCARDGVEKGCCGSQAKKIQSKSNCTSDAACCRGKASGCSALPSNSVRNCVCSDGFFDE